MPLLCFDWLCIMLYFIFVLFLNLFYAKYHDQLLYIILSNHRISYIIVLIKCKSDHSFSNLNKKPHCRFRMQLCTCFIKQRKILEKAPSFEKVRDFGKSAKFLRSTRFRKKLQVLRKHKILEKARSFQKSARFLGKCTVPRRLFFTALQ